LDKRLVFGAVLFAALLPLAMAGSANAQEAVPPDHPPAPAGGPPARFELSVEVGGAAMYASRGIMENAAASKDLTSFVAALTAAGLAETLEQPGPFTVFAPVNRAFEKLPAAAAGALSASADGAALKPVLAYHVLAGRYSAADLLAAIGEGGGKAGLVTLEGEELTVRHDGRRFEIIDARGRKATVTLSDVVQKNGVIHVIDAVLLPKS
jgi:uncharacterized surface protein with fasciclin (FAS1) repeats